MTLGIIGAMPQEVNGLIKKITNCKTTRIGSIDYHTGTIADKDVVVAKCGVGKVFAAICAQTMILNFKPDLIINIGVAGGHRTKTQIGDVVLASSTVQHDMDTSPLGDPVGMISGINIVNIPCSKDITNQVESIVNNIGIPCRIGVIATGDKFICSDEDVSRIAKSFDAIAFDMESGSIAQVCYVNEIKCCILRSISDNGDTTANIDFTEFVEKAAQIAIQTVIEYIKQYR